MNWTVFIWCVEDATEYRSFFLADLSIMAANTIGNDLRYVVRYMSTNAFGCYDINIANGHVKMILIPAQNNTSASLAAWLPDSVTGNYAIFFSSHSSGWDVGSHELISYMPSYEIRHVFETRAFYPQIIAFDGCYMSTIENAYEFHDLAEYMIACETTSPNLGMCGTKAFQIGGTPLEVSIAVARLYIARNDAAPPEAAYPTDVAVISLATVPALVTAITFASCNGEWTSAALVIPDDPNFPFYDISLVASPAAIRRVVLLYIMTVQKIIAPDQPNREQLSGMSICLHPDRYTDRGATYPYLRLYSTPNWSITASCPGISSSSK